MSGLEPEKFDGGSEPKQLEFDFGKVAGLARSVIGATPEEYFDAIAENNADAREASAPWRSPNNSPGVSYPSNPSVPKSRHISRTGPRRPRDSKGQSKYVTYPRVPDFVPLTPQQISVGKEAREAYEARKSEKRKEGS